MKQFRFKKVASILLAIAMVFTTLTVISTTEAQAATKAIKIKNVTGTTKSLNVGKTFTIKTNYTASKLTFKSSKPAIASVTSKGKITAKKVGTAKITITLKANKKVKKALTVKVNNVQKIRDGMIEEIYNPKKGKSDYRILYKDVEQPDGYQNVVFTISGIASGMVGTGSTGSIANIKSNTLCFWHGGKGEDLTKMTNADILNWWESTVNPTEVEFKKTEDDNYIRVYFEEPDRFVSDIKGKKITFVSRNALIQKKETNELYGIRYDSKEGIDKKEDTYKIFDTIEFGDFTMEDLGK